VATEVIKSIKPGGGGDYTNLTDWEDARRGDIVTGNTIEIAECYGGDCANAATISFSSGNWTTDSDHYILIRAAAGEKHAGTYDASKARIGDGSTGSVSSSVPYTYVEDMIIYTGAGGGGVQGVQALNQSGINRIDRCLFRGCKNYFLHNPSGAGTGELIVRSCIAYGNSNERAAAASTANAKITIYGCTLIAGDDCLFVGNAGATIIEDDNYLMCAGGKVIYYNPFSGTMTKGSYTATENADAVTVALRNIDYDTDNFTNVTGGSENLLIPVGSELITVGQDIGALTFDILNNTRPSGSVDIGAHNLTQPAAGGSALFVVGF
jgi:hypothetical protein